MKRCSAKIDQVIFLHSKQTFVSVIAPIYFSQENRIFVYKENDTSDVISGALNEIDRLLSCMSESCYKKIRLKTVSLFWYLQILSRLEKTHTGFEIIDFEN